MGNLFEALDEQLSDNLQKHGRYLADPHAAEEEKLNELIDALAAFVPEDRREHVRLGLLSIIKANQS